MKSNLVKQVLLLDIFIVEGPTGLPLTLRLLLLDAIPRKIWPLIINHLVLYFLNDS